MVRADVTTRVEMVGITHQGVILPKAEASGPTDLGQMLVDYVLTHENAFMVTIVVTNPRTKQREEKTVQL